MSEFRARYGPWALVTGASSGLGAEFAGSLARRGIDLVLVARRAQRLDALAIELRGAGAGAGPAAPAPPEIRTVALDLTEPSALARLEEALNGLEVGTLVNNAGFGASAPFLSTPRETLCRMVRLNCEVPVGLARMLLPGMAARGRGALITVASTAAYQATPWMAAYGATKAFDLHLGEALAVELRGSGVMAVTVSPGHTDTEFHAVAGTEGPVAGGAAAPEAVVEATLARLGRRTSFVHGWANRILSLGPRLVPRTAAARLAGRMLRSRMER